MDRLYHINWSPNVNKMSGAGFSIVLYPAFKELVSKSDIDQEKIGNILNNLEPLWLEGHGLDKELYKGSTRAQWGEWGLEHITVSGNACGLDIGESIFHKDCMELTPHNVDSLRQASQILTFFLKVVDYLMSEEYQRNKKQKTKN